MKDSYGPPTRRRLTRARDHTASRQISRAAEFFSSLPYAPRNGNGAIEIAMQILSGALENLKAAGVDHFALGVALGRELQKISDEAGWPPEVREQILGKCVEQFSRQLRP